MAYGRRQRTIRSQSSACIVFVLAFALGGCSTANMPTAEELAAFNEAGPVRPVVDLNALTRAKLPTGSYRVVVDDVLELHMPVVLRDLIADRMARGEPILCRLSRNGAIRLPIAGEINVEGKTLAEIESAVVKAYFPKYVKRMPAVTARVLEHRTARVTVVGEVEKPGIYELRSNELSLVVALVKAGGIIPGGAGAIRIRRAGETDESPPLLLPVKGLNIPFADVSLKDGDAVEVAALADNNFTVVGLVNKPGVFPYTPGVSHTLASALASAGGIELMGNPQYVKVCRQDASGRLLVVPFKISGESLTDATSIQLKPGDVIAVEQTTHTEVRRILLSVMRVSFGVHGRF